MDIQPGDIEKAIHMAGETIAKGLIRLVEVVYEWYRKRQALYYIPPPEAPIILPSPYEEQPQSQYAERNE